MTERLGGRYRLGALLGRGGSADVFAARDELLERDVAVKIAHRPDDLSIRVQARATASLDHPRIVRVLDAGQREGRAWVALDLVEGRSARELVRDRGPLEPEDAMAVLATVLDALAYMHARGVCHGDLSPGNVLVPFVGGEPDWAQARLTDLAAPVSVEGRIVVSPHYVAPEVAAGGPVEPRSDLYSAGALLMVLLTGAPPFDLVDPYEALVAQVYEKPAAPSTRRPGLSPQLDDFTLTALAKDPGDRCASAVAMAQALAQTRALGRRAPVTAPLARRPRVFEADGSHGTRPMPVLDAAVRPPAAVVAPRPAAGWALAGVAVVVVAVVAGASATGAVPTTEPSAAASSASPTRTEVSMVTRAAPSQTPTPTLTSSTLAAVPDLVGASVEDARAQLTLAGLVLGQTVEQDAPSAAGTVLLTAPAGGTAVPAGTAVVLTVASGYVLVPGVAGLPAADAASALQLGGMVPVQVTATRAAAGAVAPGSAVATVPAEGSRVPVGSQVRLLVAAAEPSSSPVATSSGPPSSQSPTASSTPVPPAG